MENVKVSGIQCNYFDPFLTIQPVIAGDGPQVVNDLSQLPRTGQVILPAELLHQILARLPPLQPTDQRNVG